MTDHMFENRFVCRLGLVALLGCVACDDEESTREVPTEATGTGGATTMTTGTTTTGDDTMGATTGSTTTGATGDADTGMMGSEGGDDSSGGAPMPEAGGPTPNGLELPEGFEDWRLLGVANRTTPEDSPSIRIILGNDLAVDAARSGAAWPDGSMIADLVFGYGDNPDWTADGAIFGGEFRALAFMVKDADEYAEDGGWAYGLWAGEDLVPAAEPDFDRACVECHTDLVADNDYVFTRPGPLPSAAALDEAAAAPNGLRLPSSITDWRVMGLSDRSEENGSVRITIGNDRAVDAGRAGDAYPNGSMIADLVWSAGAIPEWDDAVVPGDFTTIILMSKNTNFYEEDGGWAYAKWGGESLDADVDLDADQGCIDCHTERAMGNDYVFTRPVSIPRSSR